MTKREATLQSSLIITILFKQGINHQKTNILVYAWSKSDFRILRYNYSHPFTAILYIFDSYSSFIFAFRSYR